MWSTGKADNDTRKEQAAGQTVSLKQESIAEVCLNIARIISGNDRTILSEIAEGYADPRTYMDRYHDRLFEEYMLDANEMEAFVHDKWRLMADILELKGYVCTRDWKDELEDFLFFLSETRRAATENIRLDEWELPLPEDADIPQWSGQIDRKLADRGLAVGNIDMGSDAYTVFLCTVNELQDLQECAHAIGHEISFAKDLGA